MRAGVFLPLFCAVLSVSSFAEDLPEPVLLGRLPREIPESSGLALSTRRAHVYWTLNDENNAAELFAVDAQGQLLRRVEVPGARNVDWEDLAADGKGNLVIGDFGDNGCSRAECVLYVLPEPDPDKPGEKIAPDSVRTHRFRYPKEAGAQDAEALVVRDGAAFIFTKEKERARMFRLDLPEKPPAEPAVLEFVAEVPDVAFLTSASLSADGARLALLSYGVVWSFECRKEPKFCIVFKPRKRTALLGQSEGICWDGDDLLISCEDNKAGERREFWRMPKAK